MTGRLLPQSPALSRIEGMTAGAAAHMREHISPATHPVFHDKPGGGSLRSQALQDLPQILRDAGEDRRIPLGVRALLGLPQCHHEVEKLGRV